MVVGLSYVNQSTYDEIYTAFVKALQTSEDQIPELQEMLEESFVRTNGDWKRPELLHSVRIGKTPAGTPVATNLTNIYKKLKRASVLRKFVIEALVVGFTECYRQNRFEDILDCWEKARQAIA